MPAHSSGVADTATATSQTGSKAATFPWGSNDPKRWQRVAVATAITLLVCVRFYATHRPPEVFSDFSPIRFGAHALLEKRNPYELIGPGKEFDSRLPVLYPATAFALAIPFVAFPEPYASLCFVAVSAFLLVFGATRGSWHRLPMFASIAFLTTAQLAQWSMLMTAALFIPVLAFAVAAKPQTGVPIVAASTSTLALKAAVIGGVALLAVSLVLFPTWPRVWLHQVLQTRQVRAPVARLGGFLIPLVLLRWKRPESWLVFLLGILPQTWYSYNTLPLLTVGKNFRECGLLAVTSSAGALITGLVTGDLYSADTMRIGGAMVVFSSYLPVVVMILMRENSDPVPFWIRFLREKGLARNGSKP